MNSVAEWCKILAFHGEPRAVAPRRLILNSPSQRLFEALSAMIAKRRNAEARVGRSGSLRRYASSIASRGS